MTDDRPTDWKKFAGKLTDTSPEGHEFLERVIRGEVEIPTVPPVPRYRMVLTRSAMIASGGFLAAEIGSQDLGLMVWPLLVMLCIVMVAVGILWERYP